MVHIAILTVTTSRARKHVPLTGLAARPAVVLLPAGPAAEKRLAGQRPNHAATRRTAAERAGLAAEMDWDIAVQTAGLVMTAEEAAVRPGRNIVRELTIPHIGLTAVRRVKYVAAAVKVSAAAIRLNVWIPVMMESVRSAVATSANFVVMEIAVIRQTVKSARTVLVL